MCLIGSAITRHTTMNANLRPLRSATLSLALTLVLAFGPSCGAQIANLPGVDPMRAEMRAGNAEAAAALESTIRDGRAQAEPRAHALGVLGDAVAEADAAIVDLLRRS